MRMAKKYVTDRLQFRLVICGPGGIRRGIENEPQSFWRDRLLECLRRQLEPGFLRARDDDRRSFVGDHHIRIGHPVWRGNDHLCTVFHACHEREEKDLLRSTADADFVVGILNADTRAEVADDGLAQCRGSIDGRIFGFTAVDRRVGCSLDVFRCVEIGLADGQVGDVTAGCLQLAGASGGSRAG
ncbi:hypothetical protein D3C73_787850 [compost metagenome]